MTNFNGTELEIASAGNNELHAIVEAHKLCNDPQVKDLFVYGGNNLEGAKKRDVRVAAAQAVCINCVALEACAEVAQRLPKKSIFGVYAGVEHGARSTTVKRYREQMQNLITITKK